MRVSPAGLFRFKATLLAGLMVAGGGVLLGCRAPTPSPPPTRATGPFVRATNLTDGTVVLDVALRRLEPVKRRGPTIWLAAATHLGTSNYFAELQHFLDRQPLVLFEGIGATNKQFRRREQSGFSLQEALAQAVGLQFQLDAMDYDRPHFHNSDLTLAQITGLLAHPDSSREPGAATAGGSPEFGQLVEIMQGSGLLGGIAQLTVRLIAVSPRLQAATKLALIELLGGLPDDLAGMTGLTPGLREMLRVIIEERNQAVIGDLRRVLRGKPQLRSVAIFYGAGHMPPLAERIEAELGYQSVSNRWLTAFSVNARAAGLADGELAFTRRLVRSQLEALNTPAGPPPAPATLP